MSEPVVTGEVVKPPAVKMNDALMAVGILCMIVAVYLLWRSDRRLSKSDAGFRDTLRSFGERLSTPRVHTSTVNGQPYRVEHCGASCAEGHTYDNECVQRVTPNDSNTAA